MSHPATLAVELLTEELPPKALRRLGQSFADGIVAGLRARGFLAPESSIAPFATPRRLAVAITNVMAVAPDTEVVDKLMPVKVARDASGQPSEALKRKLAGLGRPGLATATLDAQDGPDRIYVGSDGKAEYVYLRSLARGQALVRGLQEALAETLENLPIPKVMSYARAGGYYNDVRFVRPARRLLALHGADVIPVTALGLAADRLTGGHRFLSRDGIEVATADAYEETLRAEGKVIAGFAERRAAIVAGLTHAAAGATLIMPDALLDEVTGLVEWPAVYEGAFEREFLTVPQECLILTMQQNQKYFALAGADGKLQRRFLVVSNVATTQPGAIIQGNERVLRARLADARFFFDQDRKTKLEARLPKLAAVVYHNKLGSQQDRVARLARLAGEIAGWLGADRGRTHPGGRTRQSRSHDRHGRRVPGAAGAHGALLRAARRRAGSGRGGDRAALLAALCRRCAAGRAGRAGRGARRQARDARRHVRHRRAAHRREGSVRPAPPCDRRDPHSRREEAGAGAPGTRCRRVRCVRRRSGGQGRPHRSSRTSSSSACAATCATPAFRRTRSRPCCASVRRASISCRRNAPRSGPSPTCPKQGRLPQPTSESSTSCASPAARRPSPSIVPVLPTARSTISYLAFQKLQPIVDDRCAAGDFAGALLALAGAKPAVDRFFDDVLVMADDPAIRANRLALLRGVAQTMNRAADISKLAT